MNVVIRHMKYIDTEGFEHDNDVIEVKLGVYSDKAFRLLEQACKLVHALSMFTGIRENSFDLDKYVTRADDGEIVFWMLKNDPWDHHFISSYRKRHPKGNSVGDRFDDCEYNNNVFFPAFTSCLECSHYLECCKDLIEDRLSYALFNLSENKELFTQKERQSFRQFLKVIINEVRDNELIGAPLDPMRLASLKVLRDELTYKWDELREAGKLEETKKSYDKLMGRYVE